MNKKTSSVIVVLIVVCMVVCVGLLVESTQMEAMSKLNVSEMCIEAIKNNWTGYGDSYAPMYNNPNLHKWYTFGNPIIYDCSEYRDGV
jgi:F0F1-type ATP synthase membrane subunit a